MITIYKDNIELDKILNREIQSYGDYEKIVKDIISKSLGSNTKLNTARATIDALKSQKSAEHIAELRGKTVEEILG